MRAGGVVVRITLLVVVLALFSAVLPVSAQASMQHYQLNIPRQPLDSALKDFARQTGLQVARFSDRVDGSALVGPLTGRLSAQEALQSLLGPGLTYKMVNERTIVIVKVGSEPTASLSTSGAKDGARAGAKNDDSEEGPTPSRSSLQLSQAAQATRAEAHQSDAVESASPQNGVGETAKLEEVVVTAEKRTERLLDVPASISAISGSTLEAQNITSLSALADYVPGLLIQDGGTPGQREIVIRGLTPGASAASTAPLSATYIGDDPVGATNGGGRSSQLGVDLMPYDLDRIEVLRGPQGFLYGADAMGGIIKYVLRQPDLAQFTVRVGGGSSYTSNAAGANYTGRGAVNIPLVTDVLAMRVSLFSRKDAGYIDNVGPGANNSNHSTESGGRVALRWKPTSNLDVLASFMTQDIAAADRTAVSLDAVTGRPVYGQYAWFSNFTEPFDQQTRFASVDVNWDMGFAKLTSSSSWSRLHSLEERTDLTTLLGSYTPGNPDALAYSRVDDQVTKYTEEIRLSSPQDLRLEWLLGLLWTRESSGEHYTLPTFTPERVPLPYDLYAYSPLPAEFFYEQAIFGSATYKINSRFDVSAGLRYAKNKDYGCSNNFGVIDDSGVLCTHRPFQGKTTWMINSRFHLDPNTLLYARVATGYRPGGGCVGCGNKDLGTPDFYYSDSLTNYEGGVKGVLLNGALQLDLSVFYIDWKNIQLTVSSPEHNQYTGNGGSASSSGFEFSSAYQLAAGLRLNATLSYTHAFLTQDAPDIQGKDGDELPQVARWSGSVTVDYSHPLANGDGILLGGGYRYRDKILNQFVTTRAPYPVGPQNVVDLYTGFVTGKLTTRVYAQNLFNDHSYSGLLLLTYPQSPAFVPIQPRTIGLSVDYQF